MHFKEINLISLAIALEAASPVQTNPKALHARESKFNYINPEEQEMSLYEPCMKSGGDIRDLCTYWNVAQEIINKILDQMYFFRNCIHIQKLHWSSIGTSIVHAMLSLLP